MVILSWIILIAGCVLPPIWIFSRSAAGAKKNPKINYSDVNYIHGQMVSITQGSQSHTGIGDVGSGYGSNGTMYTFSTYKEYKVPHGFDVNIITDDGRVVILHSFPAQSYADNPNNVFYQAKTRYGTFRYVTDKHGQTYYYGFDPDVSSHGSAWQN